MSSSSDIASRVKQMLRLTTDKKLAELLGISPQDFVGRKKDGHLSLPILNLAMGKDLDLNVLFYGRRAEPFDLNRRLLSDVICSTEKLLTDHKSGMSPEDIAALILDNYDRIANARINS